MPHDLLLFLIAVAAGLVLAIGTVIRSSPERPVWPMRLYQLILLVNPLPMVRRYAESRQSFALREQILVSWFVWFFIVFIGLILFSWAAQTRVLVHEFKSGSLSFAMSPTSLA